MKTLINDLRKATLTVLMIMSFFLSFSQGVSKVWLTIEDESNVPYVNQLGILTSTDVSFNSAISTLNITNVEKALPSSRKASLLKVYEVTCGCDVVDLYATLSNEVGVVSKVEYGPVYVSLATPNDYDLIQDHYALNLIGAQDAWNFTTGDSNVVIAISDQNYDVTHNELDGKITYYDTTNNLSSGHGTAVAIIAAGKTDNLFFKSSIGYNSSLALYRMNYNEVLSASYAGAKVINMSWTSGCEFNIYQQQAINEVYENGSFLIAAAGNGWTCGGSDSLVYPAAYDQVFSVTSIGENDNHERTAGDPTSTHQHNATIDLSAPGYEVYISPSQDWEMKGSGTSYAAPFVAGTVALIHAINPCLSNDDIAYILKSTSVNIDDLNPSYAGLIGEGRLNAAAAVEMAEGFNALTLLSNHSLSCGTYGGQIEVEVGGGYAPFTYEWSNGETGTMLSNLSAGDYTLTVTDIMGCSKDTTITIGTYTPTVFVGDIQHVTCNGVINGAVDITIIEGNPDYSYMWENGMTTEDITDLTSGTYRVTITDGNGCTVWGSFNVMEPQALTAEIVTTQPTNVVDVDIDLTVLGGTAPYFYTWNTGDVSEDLYNVTAGYYEATVIDYNGCEVMVDQVVEEVSIASIESLESIDIDIYPNPTSDYANISWQNNDMNTVAIINANGKIIEKSDVSLQSSFRTKNLKSGLYFIHLKDIHDNTYIGKLIAE